MKVLAIIVAAAAALASFGASAQKGSCPSKAISLKSSQTATLVNEYDPEEKEFYDGFIGDAGSVVLNDNWRDFRTDDVAGTRISRKEYQ